MRRLPLFVAVAAFALYAATMGGGVTANSLLLTSKLAGLDDAPMVGQPLLWLVTLPFHLLPIAWVPLALKLLAAALAAAILGLLTRTIQLLPWDHPWNAASRLTCAIPILTACVLCGLEFSFWQEATSAPGELLDLVLMAAAACLLLEYNIRKQARWLDAAAVIWGLGMAENWLMTITVPLFVVAVIWIEKLRFFRWAFVLRLAGLGFAGFAVYAVLPMFNGLNPHSSLTFGDAWLASLYHTKNAILLPYRICRGHHLLILAVTVSFLVPMLPLLIRMRDEGTHNKSGVDIFQLWLYRSLRFCLLIVCFWLALDPTPGARHMIRQELNFPMPLLTFDYLNALGAAFLIGNLLLISQLVVRDEYRRPRSTFPWKRIAVPVAGVGLAIGAAGLLVRNAGTIVHLNFHPLERFGDLAVESLPADRGAVLSDFPEKLRVFEVALARYGRRDWVAVDTRVLSSVKYRAQLEKQQPVGWLTDKNRRELSPAETTQLLEEVARNERLFYLPPSYGHFFEVFYIEPAGSILELKLRNKDPFNVPPLSTNTLQANEKFWAAHWKAEFAACSVHRESSAWTKKMAKCGLIPAGCEQDQVLGDWVSLPLDEWAVELQKQGHLLDAQVRLDQALQLNTNNISARITFACNTNLQAGLRLGLQDINVVLGQIGNPDRITNILNNCGPYDEPTMDFLAGSLLFSHGLLIQAAEQLERARVLAPGALPPDVALAEIYNQLRMPDRSRAMIDQIRQETRSVSTNSALDLNLALLESSSWLMQTNLANARQSLQAVVKKHPDDPEVASRVFSTYLAFGDVTNALDLLEERLTKMPDDVQTLNAKATVLMQAGHPADALPVLDHILLLTNLTAARVDRAFAQLDLQNFALAKGDLMQLQSAGSSPDSVNFGLALVAEHYTDTNAARHYFQLCLSNTPTEGALWQQAHAHLQAMGPVPATQ